MHIVYYSRSEWPWGDALWDVPAGNHGSCIHQNKYPVSDDENNYHDSLQAHPIEGKTIYSHGASFRPGVQMGTGEFNAGCNLAMD